MPLTWRNTNERYGLVAALLHWAIALAVIGMVALGFYMDSLDASPFKFRLYFWHKSIGVAILALVTARLLWKLANIRPAPLPSHKKWERILAHIIHLALYAALFIMPLSGWIMSSAKGISVSVFGWFTLPNIVAENKALGDTTVTVHVTAAWVLIGLVALHVLGALKHQFIDRDATLRRMLPGTALLLALLLPFSVQAQAPVTAWEIDPAASSLTFEGTQMKAPFHGEFKTFGGTILFDPERLSESRAEITIDVASVTTKSAERDDYILNNVWFDAENHPQAVYAADKFEDKGDGKWIAYGNLTLRGITLPVELPFTLAMTPDENGNKVAKMDGETTLERTAFNVGGGEWADPQSVGIPVIVRVSLTAREKQPATP